MIVVPELELRNGSAEQVTGVRWHTVLDSPVIDRTRPWRELYHIVIQSDRRELDIQASWTTANIPMNLRLCTIVRSARHSTPMRSPSGKNGSGSMEGEK